MLGTGDFALPTFEHLIETGHGVVALITQPDRPQGRKQVVIPSAIKRAAIARGIRVEQPEDINADGSLDLIRSLDPDLLVTAAYGQILSPGVLGIPSLGGINLHGSILPAYRGAAPVARAIERGEAETGVTVIRMTPRIDAGGMMAFARTPIGPDETAGELEDPPRRSWAPRWSPGRSPPWSPGRPSSSRRISRRSPRPPSSARKTAGSTGRSPPARSTT